MFDQCTKSGRCTYTYSEPRYAIRLKALDDGRCSVVTTRRAALTESDISRR